MAINNIDLHDKWKITNIMLTRV